jgi:hypothetical protein
MKEDEINGYLISNIEPLVFLHYSNKYRASVILVDGTELPCVVFESKKHQVDLAIKRFKENNKPQELYRTIVESFVTNRSTLAWYEIKSVKASPFAWPVSILNNIHGETTMGWTAFVVEMDDGRYFSYGTSFSIEFFDLPKGYTFNNIKSIYSGMKSSEVDGVIPFRQPNKQEIHTFREKTFFTCYLDGLD